MSYIVHPTNPFHLVVCFKLLGHTLTLCYLFNQTIEGIFGVTVKLKKIIIQRVFAEHFVIEGLAMLLNVFQMTLTPYADWLTFRFVLAGDDIVITAQFIFESSSFVCDKSR